jgi:excisionase family DNA binding protein
MTTTPAADKQLLTLEDACERLQVSEATIRRLVKDGELRVVRIGRAIRVRPEDLDAFIRDHLTTEE